MTSMLEKLLTGSRYMNGMDVGRRGNSHILRMQEPVGYVYFTRSNQQALLRAAHLSHPYLTLADIHDVVVDTYYRYGMQKDHYYDHRDEAMVRQGRDRLNRIALKEINRRFGNVSNLHDQYALVLDTPNRVAAHPRDGKPFSREQQTPYYRLD